MFDDSETSIVINCIIAYPVEAASASWCCFGGALHPLFNGIFSANPWLDLHLRFLQLRAASRFHLSLTRDRVPRRPKEGTAAGSCGLVAFRFSTVRGKRGDRPCSRRRCAAWRPRSRWRSCRTSAATADRCTRTRTSRYWWRCWRHVFPYFFLYVDVLMPRFAGPAELEQLARRLGEALQVRRQVLQGGLHLGRGPVRALLRHGLGRAREWADCCEAGIVTGDD